MNADDRTVIGSVEAKVGLILRWLVGSFFASLGSTRAWISVHHARLVRFFDWPARGAIRFG